MGFETFDLARVYQAAEGIKAARREGETDVLRQRYMQNADLRAQAGEDRAQAAAGREASQYNDEQRMKNTQSLVRAAQSIYDAQDPVTQAQAVVPELIQLGMVPPDRLQKMMQADPNELKASAKHIVDSFAPFIPKQLPQSTPGKVQSDVRAGLLTADQGAAALAPKPTKAPTSYDEYVRAQKDPEFAAFLKSRKGKGLSVTLPDGTTVEMGGESGSVGPQELTKPTVNNLQETIINSSNRLDRLNQLLTTYKPEYLQAKGLLKAGSSELKDFLGMDVNPEDKKFLSGYGEFKASASQEFSATLKELSGTAASESEVARVIKGVPSDQDKSPTVFEAKAKATTKFITRAIMRSNWALKNGIGINSVDELSKRMPLEGIDGVYESRANQIWQEMGGKPEARKQAIQRANQEFGIARAQ